MMSRAQLVEIQAIKTWIAYITMHVFFCELIKTLHRYTNMSKLIVFTNPLNPMLESFPDKHKLGPHPQVIPA